MSTPYFFFKHTHAFITILLLFLFCSLHAQLNVTVDRPNAYYESGEIANFNITSNTSGVINYTIKYDNYTLPISVGTLNISSGQTLSIPHQENTSGVVLCTVEQGGNLATAAAAFSPFKIENFAEEPSDFDAFWNAQKNSLANIPIDPQLTFYQNNDYSTTYRINLATVENRRVYGYLTIPNETGPFPAFITFPPYGDNANMALPEVILAERGNAISLSITIHNDEPDVADPNAYEPNDISDKHNYYYKLAVLAGVRSVDYLFSRSDFDGENLGVTGVSQGGGLSILVAGLDDRVKYLIISNPILGQTLGLQYDRAGGFPNYINQANQTGGTPAFQASVAEAANYYDAIYFARRFQGVSWSFISYEDLVTPAATSFPVFNALSGQKFLTHMLNLGHFHDEDFWNNRPQFMRRFIPSSQNAPFPFASNDQGYFIDAGEAINTSVNQTTNLSGTVEYNSIVKPNFELKWEKLSGAGNVSFSNTANYNTTVTFSEAGEYTLRLTATDFSNNLFGKQKYYTLMDEVTVTVSGETIPTDCNDPQNLALGKNTTQSTVQENGSSDRAIDENIDGDFWAGSVALTNWENQPWWAIDLEEVSDIDKIKIWNRTDCCEDFFQKFYVLLSDHPFSSNNLSTTLNQTGVTAVFYENIVGSPSEISIGQTARFVRIQLSEMGFLALAEVEIVGCEEQPEQIPQQIFFDAIADKSTTDNPFSINANATSGLPVSFEILSGPASINDDIITLNGNTGTVIVQATQAGNSQYLPAPAINRNFEVTEPIDSGCNDPQNIALGKPTSQSSTQNNGSAENAVDGNTNGIFWNGSVALTAWNSQPWWEVDLEDVSNLKEIKIWNRTDCCNEFFKDFYVLISENPFVSNDLNQTLDQVGVSDFYFSGLAETTTIIPLNTMGRYVRIQMTGVGFLNLAEVEITSCNNTLTSQQISFDYIPDKLTTDPNFFLNANATSGLPVSFQVISGPATISENLVSLTGDAGSVTIKASQNGNSQYESATDIYRTFEVEEPINQECDTPINLARNRPTSQSGTQVGATSFRAVDGNTNGNFWGSNSVTNTNWQPQAWWEVDLGGIADIETINIWNRTDCCGESLSDFYILVSDVPFISTSLTTTLNQNLVASYLIQEEAGTPTVQEINRTGRYVRVQLQGSGALMMAELEVMGCSLDLESSTQTENEERFIFPNPATDFAKIKTELFIGKDLQIWVYNSNGILVFQEKIDEVAGGTFEFSTERWETGTYVIRLKSNRFRDLTMPFQVVRY